MCQQGWLGSVMNVKLVNRQAGTAESIHAQLARQRLAGHHCPVQFPKDLLLQPERKRKEDTQWFGQHQRAFRRTDQIQLRSVRAGFPLAPGLWTRHGVPAVGYTTTTQQGR
ncbi:hypothetical protein C0Q58_24025 [Streptomyces albidoflavus]|nr:hypothetical protein C0Q58_24025 [Streptomyces albidoflavus]